MAWHFGLSKQNVFTSDWIILFKLDLVGLLLLVFGGVVTVTSLC